MAVIYTNNGSCVLKVVSAKYRPILSTDISVDISVDAGSMVYRSTVGGISV